MADEFDTELVEILRRCFYHYNTPEYIRATRAYDEIMRAYRAGQESKQASCGESAGHLIAGISWFACVLPKGHSGEHKRGGNCFAHGKYVGNQCPEWPNCATVLERGRLNRDELVAARARLSEAESWHERFPHIGGDCVFFMWCGKRIAALQAEVERLEKEKGESPLS